MSSFEENNQLVKLLPRHILQIKRLSQILLKKDTWVSGLKINSRPKVRITGCFQNKIAGSYRFDFEKQNNKKKTISIFIICCGSFECLTKIIAVLLCILVLLSCTTFMLLFIYLLYSCIPFIGEH